MLRIPFSQLYLYNSRLDLVGFLSPPTKKGPLNLESPALNSLLLFTGTSNPGIHVWLKERSGQGKYPDIPFSGIHQHCPPTTGAAAKPPCDLSAREAVVPSQNNLYTPPVEIYKESCRAIFSKIPNL